MAIRTILHFPDPRLRTKAVPVTTFDSALHTLIQDMFDTMYDANGIGLAATQINVHQQIIVMDLSEARDQPMVYINPAITPLTTDTKPYQEGCLSVPDSYESVERVAQVRIQALDKLGQPIDITADELLAVCIQHEIDHLQGILFVDHISALKRQRIKDKLLKRAKIEQRANHKT